MHRDIDIHATDGSRHGKYLYEIILALVNSQSQVSGQEFPVRLQPGSRLSSRKRWARILRGLKHTYKSLPKRGSCLAWIIPFWSEIFPSYHCLIALECLDGQDELESLTRRTESSLHHCPHARPPPTPHAIQDFGRRGVDGFSSNGHPPACQPRQGPDRDLPRLFSTCTLSHWYPRPKPAFSPGSAPPLSLF